MDLGWWLGHGFEIVGIAAVGITVALDLQRGTATSRPLLGDLKGAHLVADEEAFLGSHIRALLVGSRTRTATRRSTRGALRCARSRSATSSGSRRSGSGISRWAASCTTSGS